MLRLPDADAECHRVPGAAVRHRHPASRPAAHPAAVPAPHLAAAGTRRRPDRLADVIEQLGARTAAFMWKVAAGPATCPGCAATIRSWSRWSRPAPYSTNGSWPAASPATIPGTATPCSTCWRPRRVVTATGGGGLDRLRRRAIPPCRRAPRLATADRRPSLPGRMRDDTSLPGPELASAGPATQLRYYADPSACGQVGGCCQRLCSMSSRATSSWSCPATWRCSSAQSVSSPASRSALTSANAAAVCNGKNRRGRVPRSPHRCTADPVTQR